ncbi:MAG: AIR synthase related protein [Lachnospirales bacterium]
MSLGKIENKHLGKLLSGIKNSNIVLVNPKIGEDCSVVDMEGENLIVTSDPITSVVKDIGSLAIDVNLNDLYTLGATPIGVTVTMLFPEDTCVEEIEKCFNEINLKCQKEGLNLLGGHTEITDAVIRPIISVTAIGKTENKKYLSYDFDLGDEILLSKGFAIEGTVILLENYFEDIVNDTLCIKKYYEKLFYEGNISKKVFDDILYEDSTLAIADFNDILNAYKDSLSIKKEVDCVKKYKVKIHDVTEGGVFGGLYEILESKGFGCNINLNYLDIHKVTRRICAKFNVNPYKLISSGSAIIITNKSDVSEVKKELHKNNILVYDLGDVTEGDKIMVINNVKNLLINNEKDELYKIKKM